MDQFTFLKIFTYRNIGWMKFIRYIVSYPPSAELLPFIQDLNPDRFPWINLQRVAGSLIAWLREFCPIPHELIQLWEDYCSMESCNLRIIADQAECWMLKEDSPSSFLMKIRIPAFHDLLAMRMLLDISWDEMRRAILLCTSRVYLMDGTHIDLDPYLKFGHFVRMSPPESPELLQTLQDFNPHWDLTRLDFNFQSPIEFHYVLQWLKVCDQYYLGQRPKLKPIQAACDPPPSMIVQWIGYLKDAKLRQRDKDELYKILQVYSLFDLRIF
ncbi:hypothetical protein K438DRAFT_1762983 [Mycena galopus ATCC 62051]|nr:hypothetical protein K438DRAFT_1762983 [Mycena galopus ATCC 62051]